MAQYIYRTSVLPISSIAIGQLKKRRKVGENGSFTVYLKLSMIKCDSGQCQCSSCNGL